MPRKTITELVTEATTNFPDNTTGLISPADLRTFVLDFLNTVRPAYGVVVVSTATPSQALTTTPAQLTWESVYQATAPDFTASAASGTVTAANGPATVRISFNIDVVAPNNSITTFTLFKNDTALPWRVSNTSTSSTDRQSFSLTAIDYTADQSTNYQIRASSNGNNTITYSNAVFVVENVPVNTN